MIHEGKRPIRFGAALCLVAGVCLMVCGSQPAAGQRDSDDDFDDAGFDDSGYNQPQNHDAEGSNQNPSNYSPSSEEDLDDDDDVDETHVRPQVADETGSRQQAPSSASHNQQAPIYNQEPLYNQQAYYGANLAPQRFYSSPNSLMLANVYPGNQQMRYKRQVEDAGQELDVETSKPPGALIRKRRHSKYIGPVYTYVKTDKHAHYKWGVKHKVGKSKHYG